MMRLKSTSLLFAVVFLLGASICKAQEYEYPFQNPELPIEKRVDNILAEMTLEEKINALGTDPDVPRLGIEAAGHLEGYHGLAMGGPANWAPEDPIPTTQFPQAVGMGQTWNPELIRKAGAIEAEEARYIYHNEAYDSYDAGLVIRAPNADLARDIRWGRTEEAYGEDPYHVGKLSVAFIQGLQGDHPRYWRTAALMKHFLANSNEDTRVRSSSNFGERLLREYYAVPFRMGVKQGGSRSYMAAYNAYNEIPMTVHPIIKNLTIDEWGVNGVICTDAYAVGLMVGEHEYYPDTVMASAATVKAGINQFLDRYEEPVTKAVDQDLLTEKDLDQVLRGSYRVMIKLGLLDPDSRVPYNDIDPEVKPWETAGHRETALELTRESIVLLKNEDDILPIDKGEISSIAVIGPRSDEVLLDWYSGMPPYRVTPLEGIKKAAGEDVNILHTENYKDSAEVTRLARKVDIAVVVAGNHPTGNAGWAEVAKPSYGKEAVDRKSINLEDEALVKRVYRANPNTVFVLKSSFPYAINWSRQHVPGLIHIAHNSQEEGNALADVLFGDYNPGGRTVHTWPRSQDQIPPLMEYDIREGATYRYFEGDPLFPFGYGLSYTDFQYSNLELSTDRIRKGEEVTIRFNVANTGDRKGDEVSQLYIKHQNSRVPRPQKELKGFERITLEPGESRTLSFTLSTQDLTYWDADRDRFDLEQNLIKVMIGPNSKQTSLQGRINVVKED